MEQTPPPTEPTSVTSFQPDTDHDLTTTEQVSTAIHKHQRFSSLATASLPETINLSRGAGENGGK